MPDAIENVSISLGEYDRDLLKNHVENGRFGSKSEVVRAGLRLLDDYEHSQSLLRLRAEIAKGEADLEAGRYTDYDDANDLLSKIKKNSPHQPKSSDKD